MGFFVCVIIVAIIVLKELKDDRDCRNSARRKGYDIYASSTGLRYTDSNKQVYHIDNYGKGIVKDYKGK